MELPKNITQIGESNPHCKVYVEDYVISYIKQLNQSAGDRAVGVALYGIGREEAGVTYIFFYGACRAELLQKECRHLSQAVQQEVEKKRRKHFPEYTFLGYCILNGEMVEGFHVCEQNVCRYIEGYAQFYEKNDKMLAFMLEERQEEVKPEAVDQSKYDEVKKRQEERRAAAEGRGGHAVRPQRDQPEKPGKTEGVPPMSMRNMKIAAAGVFTFLGVVGLAAMGGSEGFGEWRAAAGRLVEGITEKQLPDAAEDTSYARLYLASTMLQEGAADVLELPEDERDALLMVRGVVSKEAVIDVQQAGAVIDLIRNDGVSPLLRGMLARAELDILVRSGGWQDLREEIMTLAEFLSGYTADQMDRCTGLLMEVRSRCGKM